MFNKVIFLGNLTRDVELRYLPSGMAVAVFGMASNRRTKKQDGSITEEPCFIDVKLFGRTAEVANQYLRKGSRLMVEGRLSYESWTDQTGAKKSRHVIIAENINFIDKKEEVTVGGVSEELSNQGQFSHQTQVPSQSPMKNQGQFNQTQVPNQTGDQAGKSVKMPIEIPEEEIPF